VSQIVVSWHRPDEMHIVFGWDVPLSSYFWKEFNKEPERDLQTGEVNWDNWEEIKQAVGYKPNELPTMNSLRQSMPPEIRIWLTDEVEKKLDWSVGNDDGRLRIDMSHSFESYQIEVRTEDTPDSWTKNVVYFDNETEAKQYGEQLARVWTAVKEWRVVKCDSHPPSHQLDADGMLVVVA
jgi:hypothetical protein